jgi:hypothetical protein
MEDREREGVHGTKKVLENGEVRSIGSARSSKGGEEHVE